MSLTMGELFAGIGGFSVGFHRAGFETRWAVEWDRDCQRVLRYHWPDVRIYGDVREFTYKAVPSLQRDETAGLISSAQDRANGAALVVQDLRQPVRTRDAEQAVHARATAAMVVDDALSHDTGRYGGDAGNAEQRMRDLPATNEPSLRRSRSRNWEGARAPLPSVQHQTGGDRGSGFPIGGDGVSAPEFVDIITGGFPCQDLSVAGKRAGLDGERSGLFFEFMRVIREMQEASDGEYPRFAIFENVPCFLSSSGNRDFGIALSEMVGCEVSCPADGWGTCGVVFGPLGQAAWRILDAQYFGVAQRRRRVFIVYDPRGERAGQVLIEPDGLSGHPAPRREAREDVVGTICGGSGERGWAPDTDRMTFVAIQDGSMPRAKKQNGIGIAYDAPMYTLDGHGAHAVAATVSAKWAKGTGGPSGDEALHLVAHTLTANGADASEDGTGRGTPLVAFNWQSGGDQRLGLSAERVTALGTSQTPAVAFMQNQRDEVRDLGNVAGALPAQPGMKQENYVAQHEVFPTLAANRGRPGSQDWQQHAAATSGTAVRRLTPRECERLQGFPDVRKTVTIRPCLNCSDHPKTSAIVDSQSHRSLRRASHVAVTVLTEHVPFAERHTAPKHPSDNRPVALSVRIDCERNEVELHSHGRLLWSASGADSQSSYRLPMPVKDFVRLAVRTISTAEQTIQDGRAASPSGNGHSTLLPSGALCVPLCGRENDEPVSDAVVSTTAQGHRSTSITLPATTSSPPSDSTLATLLCSAASAISSCIPDETQDENSSGFSITTTNSWTAVDGMADSPRYRMLGNAVAVPVVEWIGRRIAEALA